MFIGLIRRSPRQRAKRAAANAEDPLPAKDIG